MSMVRSVLILSAFTDVSQASKRSSPICLSSSGQGVHTESKVELSLDAPFAKT